MFLHKSIEKDHISYKYLGLFLQFNFEDLSCYSFHTVQSVTMMKG